MDFTVELDNNTISIIPSGDLTYNTVYQITIDANASGYLIPTDEWQTLSTDYTFWFTSQYCPLFTTIGRIKIEAGNYAESLIDDTIYRMIHKNSLDAIDIYNTSTNNTYSYEQYGCTWDIVPYLLRRYVECKTAFDIISLVDMASNSSGGDQLKTLGDLTIKYGAGGNAPTPDGDRKKQLYDCWNEFLNSIKGIQSAVRGYYDTSKGYPHTTRSYRINRVIKPEWATARPFTTPGDNWWRRI